MAYMDFRAIDQVAHTGPALRPAPAARAADPIDPALVDFTPLEWTVIALARTERDAPRFGAPARLMALLFGDDRARPLADPRLEALRQAAIALWHRRAFLDVATLARHDFTPAHIDLLTDSIVKTGR